MKVNHNKYRLFEYINNPSKEDAFILGDVVYKESEDSVGVIIQCHGNDEYRTDQFGNCSNCPKYGDIRLASMGEIERLRPEIILGYKKTEKLKREDKTVELFDDRMCFKRGNTTFYPDEPYRAIILSEDGQRQVLVNGEIFSGEEFDNEFKLRFGSVK